MIDTPQGGEHLRAVELAVHGTGRPLELTDRGVGIQTPRAGHHRRRTGLLEMAGRDPCARRSKHPLVRTSRFPAEAYSAPGLQVHVQARACHASMGNSRSLGLKEDSPVSSSVRFPSFRGMPSPTYRPLRFYRASGRDAPPAGRNTPLGNIPPSGRTRTTRNGA